MRGGVVWTTVLAAAVLIVVTAGCSDGARPAKLEFGDDVANDLRALAESTWEAFATTFEARLDCFPGVRLTTSEDLGERATYDPATATITVQVPRTAAILESALIHEMAHHVEFTCPGHAELRPAFLAAQGLAADGGWFDGATWEETPSEQFAEATVEVVLGERQDRRQIVVGEEARRVVAEWGAG